MRQSGAGWPALAALAIALLFACVTRESDEEEAGWYGVIRNTCGPADGPAVMLRIEEHPVTACGATGPDTAAGRYRMYIADALIDSLRPGSILRDTLDDPARPGDYADILTFTVESATPQEVGGRLEMVPYGDGTPGPAHRRDVTLKVCPREFGFCG